MEAILRGLSRPLRARSAGTNWAVQGLTGPGGRTNWRGSGSPAPGSEIVSRDFDKGSLTSILSVGTLEAGERDPSPKFLGFGASGAWYGFARRWSLTVV